MGLLPRLLFMAAADVLLLADAAKKKKSKTAAGAPCSSDQDCGLPELYCKREEDREGEGICAMRVGLSHPCTDNRQCLSGYCGSSGLCEFSTHQMLVMLVVAACVGLLVMAAAAPPKHKQLYPKRQKVRWQIAFAGNTRGHRRQRTPTDGDSVMGFTTDNTDATDFDADLDGSLQVEEEQSDSGTEIPPPPPIIPVLGANLSGKMSSPPSRESDIGAMVETEARSSPGPPLSLDITQDMLDRKGSFRRRPIAKVGSDTDEDTEDVQRRRPARKLKSKPSRKLDLQGWPAIDSSPGSSPPSSPAGASSPEMQPAVLPQGATHFNYDEM